MPDEPIPSLWPEEVSDTAEVAPVSILKKQAVDLYEKTGYIINGQVSSSAQGNELRHSFYFVVPAMDNYRYRLLYVEHQIQRLYPVILYSDVHARNHTINNKEELIQTLKEVFASDETKRVIHTLKASSES